MEKSMNPRLKITIAMIIWGSLGLFIREIHLDSISVAMFRAIIGSLFLLSISIITKDNIDKNVLKENLPVLIVSGVALSLNWIAFFQAIKYTTIPIAVLSYNTAPIFITLFSAIILKEKLTLRNLGFLMMAVFGVLLVVYSKEVASAEVNHLKGILFGLAGAVLYGTIIVLNKLIKGLSGFQITLIQLAISAIVLIPIVIKQGNLALGNFDLKLWVFLLILGILHTGIAYLLYFPSIKDVKSSTIAILCYLDPIVAILTSFIFLKESMTIVQAIGGILILSAAYFGDK